MSCTGIIYVPNMGRLEVERNLGSKIKEILGERAYVSDGPIEYGYAPLDFDLDEDYFDTDELDKIGKLLKKNYQDAVCVAVTVFEGVGEEEFFAYLGGKFWHFNSYNDDFAGEVNKFVELGDLGKELVAFLVENQHYTIEEFRNVKGLENLPAWEEFDEDDDDEALWEAILKHLRER